MKGTKGGGQERGERLKIGRFSIVTLRSSYSKKRATTHDGRMLQSRARRAILELPMYLFLFIYGPSLSTSLGKRQKVLDSRLAERFIALPVRRTSIPDRALTETEVTQLYVSLNVSSPCHRETWLLFAQHRTTSAERREVVFNGRLRAL